MPELTVWVTVTEVRKMKLNKDFNAQKVVYENLIKNSIIGPTKAIRATLESAVSVASMLLTAGVVGL